MEAEILASDRLPSGEQYVRYAGWRDETRRVQGLGDYRFRRPDGGEIVADLLNDHRIQIPPIGRELVIRTNGNSTLVHYLPTDRWVDMLTYSGSLSDLEYREWTIDVLAEFVIPALRRFWDRLQAGGRWGDRTGTTLNLIVGASTDDASERYNGAGFENASTLNNMGSNTNINSTYQTGARFTGGPPQGSTINSATWTVYFTSTALDDIRVTISADDVDSSPTFDSTNDVNGRTRTTANVAWTSLSAGVGDEVSPDIASVIQEVVDRAGYSGTLTILGDGRTDANGNCQPQPYDGSTTNTHRLDIDYTYTPPATTPGNLLLLGVG